MDPTPFPSDVLAEAEARVAQARLELEAKRAEARRVGEHIDWLDARPDLARLNCLIMDHARLQTQLTREREEYQQALKQRLREVTEACPFQTPLQLEEGMDHLRWLLQELTPNISRQRLESLLNDHRLGESDKASISARMRSECCNAEWIGYIELVGDRLRRKRQELQNLENDHYNKLRLGTLEELRRLQNQIDSTAVALDEAVAALPHGPKIKRHIANCIDRFVIDQTQRKQAAYVAAKQELDRHIGTMLQSLFALPATEPCILNEEVHTFLERHHRRLVPHLGIATPLAVAHIGHLIGKGDYAGAGELLNRLPTEDNSPLGRIGAYLRYVVSEAPELSGTTKYRTLSEHDLFLGACYYNGPAFPALTEQLEWDHASLEYLLSQRDLNDFKVSGLQPRIAELAFYAIYTRLHGVGPKWQLHDMNLECVKRLRRPWNLDSRPMLPGHDWEALDGKKYDVKSNLFYRSKQESRGLRGFLIKRSSVQGHSFPGFVFTHTDDEACAWLYVGEYRSVPAIAQDGDRVLPFCFRLRWTPLSRPKKCRP